jgi:hypothetical protein
VRKIKKTIGGLGYFGKAKLALYWRFTGRFTDALLWCSGVSHLSKAGLALPKRVTYHAKRFPRPNIYILNDLPIIIIHTRRVK